VKLEDAEEVSGRMEKAKFFNNFSRIYSLKQQEEEKKRRKRNAREKFHCETFARKPR
jgi:hypothetical protein